MENVAVYNPEIQPKNFTPEEVALIKSVIAKDTTDDELKLFLYQCKRTRLDPLSKQIYPMKRWNADLKREVLSFQVSIDGMRLIANRTGKYRGQTQTFYCGMDGVWKEVWLSDEPPAAAKIGVYREDFAEPLWATAKYSSYVVLNKEGKPVGTWARMPEVMLSKVAESLALRKAFPHELAGIYSDEEMQQAENKPADFKKPLKPIDQPKSINELKQYRNYTQEAAECGDLDELSKWWNTLNPGEKKLLQGLKNSRKEELLKEEEAAERELFDDDAEEFGERQLAS